MTIFDRAVMAVQDFGDLALAYAKQQFLQQPHVQRNHPRRSRPQQRRNGPTEGELAQVLAADREVQEREQRERKLQAEKDLAEDEQSVRSRASPPGEEPRTQAPQPALLAAFVAWAMQKTPQRRIVTLAARYASLGGSRKAEFLDLAWPQVDREAGQIRTKHAKQRGKKRGEVIDVVAISPALGQVLDELATLRRPDCLYVFRRGTETRTPSGPSRPCGGA